jgi:hypothetical protein
MRTPSRRFALLVLLALSCADPTGVSNRDDRAFSPVARGNSNLGAGDVRTIFGPERFTRGSGTPATQTIVLSGYAPNATLRILNGDAQGKDRVTSARIAVNGVEVVGPSEFSNKVESIVRPIALSNPATITVSLASAPGSFLTISIDGALATEAPIPPTGGRADLLGGQVSVDIPSGALSSPTTITAEPVPQAEADPAALPNTSIDMGPDGTTFSQPIALAIAFDPASLPRWVNPAGLRMYWRNVDHWELLDGNAVDLEHSRVTAQTTHFSEFALLPDAREFCPGDPTADADLQAAVNAVPVGGTVYVCDGAFTVDEVHVNKALTLRAEHHGMATLHDGDPAPASTANRPALRIENPNGAVRIVSMNFDVSGRGIVAQNHNVVEIDSSTFVGRSLIPHLVAVPGGSTVPGTGRVDIWRSTFQSMSIGVFATGNAEANVYGSTFDNFSGGSITHSQSTVPNVGSVGAKGIIEGNVFRNCQVNGCIRTFARSSTIRGNTFELPSGVSRLGAIVIGRNANSIGIEPLIIEDNEILAAPRGGDPTLSSSYTAASGISWQSGGNLVADTVRRNRIVSAFAGLQIASAAVRVYATDNTVQDGARAFTHSLVGGQATIQRNDFVNLLGSFAGIASGNYQCNWWGSNGGPTSPGSGSYVPWAAAAIAGTSVSCDPTAAPSQVLMCPTANASTLPRFTTLATAVANVSSGGTVFLCDGTHAAANVSVAKPLTLTSQGPGVATLDAPANAAALSIANVAGTVEVHHLRFTGASASSGVSVFNNVTTASIHHNEFNPGVTNPYPATSGTGFKAGVSLFGTGIGAATISNNQFLGGDLGVQVNQVNLVGTNVQITNNTFTGQVNMSVFAAKSSPSALNIEGNTFSDCGINACIRSLTPARVVGNTMSARLERRINGEVVSLLILGTSTTLSEVTDNVVAGTGNGGSRSSALSYPAIAAFRVEGGIATVSRNQVTDIYQGVVVISTSAVTGSDNAITTTWTPFNTGFSGVGAKMIMNRNDLTDYVTAVGGGQALTADPAVFSVRCNWWGSDTGPSNVLGGVPASSYTPWAAEAIANTAVSCAPDAPVTQVLMCPTSNGSTLPRFTTMTAAIGAVASGGTVYVCDGTHASPSVFVNKPMTITSQGPGVATLDGLVNGGALTIGAAPGTVTLHHLRFTGIGGTNNVTIGANVTSVSIHHNEFNPATTNAYPSTITGDRAGVRIAGIGIGTVTITDNQFLGGDVGVSVGQINLTLAGTNVQITNNTFTGQVNSSILGSRNTPAAFNVEGNTFADCGITACIRSLMPVRIVGNTMNARIERPVNDVINLMVQGTSALSSEITDNVLTGTGSNGPRTITASYPAASAFRIDGAVATISRNQVTNVFWGMNVFPNSDVTGTDNRITTTSAPLMANFGLSASRLIMSRSDLTDYLSAVGGFQPLSTDPAIFNVRCNWWGSDTGPANVSGIVPVSGYSPWALVPIAGTSVSCTP